MSPYNQKSESGYSLVELLAAIVILTVAIIPMVTMFDTGLRSATTSGNYDKARAIANQKLEESKSIPYDTVRSNFPSEATSGKGAPGSSGKITSSDIAVPASFGMSQGSTYTVEKQYVTLNSPTAPTSFVESSSADDTRLLRITVTVEWSSGNSYSASGLVTG